MRISTSMVYDLGSSSIDAQDSAVYKTQAQMSSGNRMLSSADDPAGASAALRINQNMTVTQQQQSNQTSATNTLSQSESTLGSTVTVLQSATSLLQSAQNSTLSQSNIDAIVTQLQGLQGQLLSLANSQDSSGNYLFSGYSVNTQPFAQTAGGVTYNGDDGNSSLQVAPNQSINTSVNGDTTFMRIKNGNGVFATAAGTANTGSGVIDSGTVASPSALTGDAYQVKFNVSGGTTTYDVVDTTSGTTLSTGNAFNSGSSITVGGEQFTITGQPADGDTFSATPSSNESVFKMLADGIAALQSTTTSGAVRDSQVNSAIANLNQAMDNISQARTIVGTNMNSVTTLTTISSNTVLTQKSQLSTLQDLDYTQATTQLSEQQVALQAAQQSFSLVSKLSLFNYLA